jgi:hypothetical protein
MVDTHHACATLDKNNTALTNDNDLRDNEANLWDGFIENQMAKNKKDKSKKKGVRKLKIGRFAIYFWLILIVIGLHVIGR